MGSSQHLCREHANPIAGQVKSYLLPAISATFCKKKRIKRKRKGKQICRAALLDLPLHRFRAKPASISHRFRARFSNILNDLAGSFRVRATRPTQSTLLLQSARNRSFAFNAYVRLIVSRIALPATRNERSVKINGAANEGVMC